MARIMEIYRELIKTRKHNEKYRFYDISKFSNVDFQRFFGENKEISYFLIKNVKLQIISGVV